MNVASRLAVGVDRKTTNWTESVMTKRMMEFIIMMIPTPVCEGRLPAGCSREQKDNRSDRERNDEEDDIDDDNDDSDILCV